MKIKILLLFLFLANISIAQEKGLIYYGFIDALGNGNAKGPDYNAYMVFNKDQSYYVTAKDSLEKAEKINEQKIYQNKDGNGGSIHNGMKSSPQGDQVVCHIKKNTMWSNFLYRKQIYIKELVPKIDWKIEKDTKKIGKFICKKATAFFGGRHYTAWYCPDIPVPFGPWKLNGLPGLIMEAYDVNQFVYWYFKSVEYPSKNKENVKYIKTSKENIFILNEEFKNFREKEQIKAKEKGIIIQKEFPDITFIPPTLSQMFIEFE